MNEKLLVDVQRVGGVDIQNGQCEGPVYNEIEEFASANLNAEIAQFEQAGIEVHVQVVRDLDGLSNVQQYADAVTEACGWYEQDSMVVTVMFDGEDVLFDVVRSGKIDVLVANSGRVSEIDAVFEDSLSDASVPFEDAVADMLDITQRVTSESAEAPVQPPKSETAQPPKEDTHIDVPYGPIGIGVGVLGVFGAGAALVRNRKRFNTEARAVELEISTNRVNIYDAIEKAKFVASTLPASETEALAQTISSLEEANAKVNSGRMSAENALEQQRGRFVRSTAGLRDILSQPLEDGVRLSDAMRAASEQAEDLMITVSTIEESIQTIDDRLQTFVAGVAEFATAQDAVNAKGYASKAWRAAYKELALIAEEAKQQRASGAVLAVQDLIAAQETRLAELIEKVAAVPGWHERVVAAYDTTLQQQQDTVARLEQAKDAAAAVRATYDPSCFGDIDAFLTNAGATLEKVAEYTHTLPRTAILKKDIDAIAENETTIANMQQMLAEVAEQSDAVLDHKALLERIAESAPTQVDAIGDDIASVLDLANGYGSDVEPETVAGAHALQNSAAQLAALLQDQKPHYLKIQKTAETLEEDVRNIAAKVQSEYAEMVRMRADVETGSAKLDNAVRSLGAQAQSNASDLDANTKLHLQSLETYAGEPRTREELRSAVQTIASLVERYNQVANAVSNDIQQAKNRRAQAARSRSTGYGGGGYSTSSRSSGSTRRSSSSSSRRVSGGSRSSSRSSGSTKRR